MRSVVVLFRFLHGRIIDILLHNVAWMALEDFAKHPRLHEK